MDLERLVQFLVPFLPYLLKAGEKAMEEIGKQFGAEAWERARTLWGKLRPTVEAKPAAQEAAQDVAADPRDADAQAALRLQLKKLLAEDPALAEDVSRLWGETPPQVVNQVIAGGDRSVAVGGSVSGSAIITGDRNQVKGE